MSNMVVRPKLQTLGDALAADGKPTISSGKKWRVGHPTLTSPDIRGSLPVRATQGVDETQLRSYLKAAARGY